MTVCLTDIDVEEHVKTLPNLPLEDDLGKIEVTEHYFHEMAMRFWETFCEDEQREEEFLKKF